MAEKKILSKTDFNLFRDYIETRTGIHIDEGKQYSIALNLDTRMHDLGLKDYSDYYAFLTTNAQGMKEFAELLDLILIKETFFFRDERQIKVLIHDVLPALMEKKDGKEIKIWSAGCATGEEPYTLAMAIMENFPAGSINYSIYATDISAAALSYAKNGVYGKGSMRAIDRSIMSRYFIQKDGRYHLMEAVKQLVRFDVLNLVEPYRPTTSEGGFDVVICKNVIIYFELETVKKVIHRVYDTLVAGGYFFVGHSESLWQVSNEFTLEEISGVFLYRKNACNSSQSPSALMAKEKPVSSARFLPAASVVSFQQYKQRIYSNGVVAGIKESRIASRKNFTFAQPSPQTDGTIVTTPAGRKALHTADDNAGTKEELHVLLKKGLLLTGDDDEILEDIQTIIERDPKNADAHLFLGKVCANMGQYDKALRKVADVLDIDDLNAEAYELMGSIYYKNSEKEKAIASFKRAVYLNEKTLLSHYYLGNMYKDANLFRQAIKEYKNVMRAVEADSRVDELLVGEVFTVKQLNEICARNVELLSGHV